MLQVASLCQKEKNFLIFVENNIFFYSIGVVLKGQFCVGVTVPTGTRKGSGLNLG
jgi:hypothetical protein